MTPADLSQVAWRKSSYSVEQGRCVEVAFPSSGLVAIRDSKQPSAALLVSEQVFAMSLRHLYGAADRQ